MTFKEYLQELEGQEGLLSWDKEDNDCVFEFGVLKPNARIFKVEDDFAIIKEMEAFSGGSHVVTHIIPLSSLKLIIN